MGIQTHTLLAYYESTGQRAHERAKCLSKVRYSFNEATLRIQKDDMESIRSVCILSTLRTLSEGECKLLPRSGLRASQSERQDMRSRYFVIFLKDKQDLRADHEAAGNLIDLISRESGLSKKTRAGVPSPRHVLSMEAVTELRNCRDKIGSHPFEGGDYERDDES